MPKLTSKAGVLEELQEAYDHLLAGDDWDLSDKAWWDVRLKLLTTALAAADDSDLEQRILTLQGKLDELLAKDQPKATVRAIRPGKAG